MSDTGKMSTGTKWLIGLAVFLFILFLAKRSPVSPSDYVREGNQVWIVAGHRGTVLLPTGAETIGNHWSGTVTLRLHAPGGRPDIVGAARSTEEWGSSIRMSKKGTLDAPVSLTIPKDLPAGTTLTGTLTGRVTTPQYNHGRFSNYATDVDRQATFHLATRSAINHRYGNEHALPSWLPAWVLAVPLLVVVLVFVAAVVVGLARR